MQAFAKLLDTMASRGSTLLKRRLMADYFKATDDPERGWALAALAGTLSFPTAKPKLIRELVASRVDPVLYALSRDYVGDMAETVALVWPDDRHCGGAPSLSAIVEILSQNDRKTLQSHLDRWLDGLDRVGRWALLKLITGNLRIGVSARLAKTALADGFGKDLDQIEQLWHGLSPPYESLFAWLEGKAEKPEPASGGSFLPMMLSHPILDSELAALDLEEFQVEPKWDGVRVQLARAIDQIALYSRTGDDISQTFPDIVHAALQIDEQEFVLDGELLTKNQNEICAFQCASATPQPEESHRGDACRLPCAYPALRHPRRSRPGCAGHAARGAEVTAGKLVCAAPFAIDGSLAGAASGQQGRVARFS